MGRRDREWGGGGEIESGEEEERACGMRKIWSNKVAQQAGYFV